MHELNINIQRTIQGPMPYPFAALENLVRLAF